MRIPGIKTAKKLSRWLQAHVLGGALILGYHRVASLERDEYDVCVTPEHFDEQMEMLNRYAHPISLSQLVEHLKAGSLPSKSVAVTFDDGYTDNLYQAKPVLEKYSVPATVFVCTGYADKEFWWDEMERLVTSSQADLHTLRLQLGENQFQWEQPDGNSDAGNLEIRRQFQQAIYHFLLSLDIDNLTEAMETIRTWSGVSGDDVSTSRGMNRQELLQLTDGGLVDLGAHTRHHPMLPHLSLERQQDEIVSSKKDLENLLGIQVMGFAYPNGRATTDAKRITREAGFAFACTSLHNVVRPGSDLYELTRFWQKDVDGDRFLQGIQLWMKS
jgi:peptidoglycan/xylan/chitin deacetylase (PgdA/CDA1 family)